MDYGNAPSRGGVRTRWKTARFHGARKNQELWRVPADPVLGAARPEPRSVSAIR